MAGYWCRFPFALMVSNGLLLSGLGLVYRRHLLFYFAVLLELLQLEMRIWELFSLIHERFQFTLFLIGEWLIVLFWIYTKAFRKGINPRQHQDLFL